MAQVKAPGETSALRPVDPTVVDHARRIVPDLESLRGAHIETRDRVRAIWERVSTDETIIAEFKGAEIRAATMRGNVANQIMELLGDRGDFIQLMSIGDVELPPFIKPLIRDIYARASDHHLANLDEHGTGYDLASKGLESARSAMIQYFDRHYGFSNVPGLMQVLTKNACITNGGMRALDDIATGLVNRTLDRRALPGDIVMPASRVTDRRKQRPAGAARSPEVAPGQDRRARARFVYPDNSFGTWKSIVNLRTGRKQIADFEELPTSQEAGLHLTAEDVSKFYQSQDAEAGLKQDTWYITPVGNPSGTSMTPEQLYTTCSAIVAHSPQAVIILDSVYVRTLPAEKAKELFAGVINSPEILSRAMFVESFSKTHGLCGERIGAYFSANADIFSPVQNVNMTLAAGNGHFRSAMVQSLCDTTADQEAGIQGLHRFWARERQGLHQYLLGSGKFSELFDQDQSHIHQEDLQDPLGLYLFVKLQPGVTSSDVLYATGCLGVDTPMGSGKYMRFAVGKFTEPTYAKYAPSSQEQTFSSVSRPEPELVA